MPLKVIEGHDPTSVQGCQPCPMFDGVARDGVCRALGGRTLHFRKVVIRGEHGGALTRQVFAAPQDCPFHNGAILIVAPKNMMGGLKLDLSDLEE